MGIGQSAKVLIELLRAKNVGELFAVFFALIPNFFARYAAVSSIAEREKGTPMRKNWANGPFFARFVCAITSSVTAFLATFSTVPSHGMFFSRARF